MPKEPKIEHVFYNPENPMHRKHLAELSLSDHLERHESRAMQQWVSIEEHQKTPFHDFVSSKLKKYREEAMERRESLRKEDVDENSRLVLQYFNGEPVGYAKYVREADRPNLYFIFVKPEMRDTLSDTKPALDLLNNYYLLPKLTKRKNPLFLAKNMIDFITKTEGKVPHAIGQTTQGYKMVNKYIIPRRWDE